MSILGHAATWVIMPFMAVLAVVNLRVAYFNCPNCCKVFGARDAAGPWSPYGVWLRQECVHCGIEIGTPKDHYPVTLDTVSVPTLQDPAQVTAAEEGAYKATGWPRPNRDP
jgi:hypothetical protein